MWVFSTPDVAPPMRPFSFPHLLDRGYSHIRRVFDVESTLPSALENALDVPHTAFLHGGLFRTEGRRTEIEVRIRRAADRVEAEFIGEPRPLGFLGSLLSPRGGVVTHFDRFLLPSIAQVEYRLGRSHLVITTAMTPITDRTTRLHAVASFKLRVPSAIVKLLVAPIAARIVRQDVSILASQSRTIRRFGEEKFSSTEIDVLGPHIRHLLEQSQLGRGVGSRVVFEHTVHMRV